MLLIFILGYQFRWREIARWAWILPGLAMILTLLVPESPIHLLRRGKEEEAKKALNRLYGEHNDNQRIVDNTKENLLQLSQKVRFKE